MNWRRETGNIRIDHHNRDALINGLLQQWRGGEFIVCTKDDRIDILRQDVLDHAHLTVYVSAALGGQHKDLDAGLGSDCLDAFTNRDVVVELGRWRHIGDAESLVLGRDRADRRLGTVRQRNRRRIVSRLRRSRHCDQPGS